MDFIDRRLANLERVRRGMHRLLPAGYGDMHPQSRHFIATIELFTGIFSMSLMTGLIFARFSRPSARLLFANNPVVSSQACRP